MRKASLKLPYTVTMAIKLSINSAVWSTQKDPFRLLSPHLLINNNMLRQAPKFYEGLGDSGITDNAILVAHNAQFDYRILEPTPRDWAMNLNDVPFVP